MQFRIRPNTDIIDKAIASIDGNERLIVCGAPENGVYLEEQLEMLEDVSIDDIIDQAEQMNVERWFEATRSELEEEYETTLDEIMGEWFGPIDDKQPFTLDTNILTGEPLPEVLTTTVSAKAPWEVLAHFGYGGWNDCPGPDEHCAVWRHWFEKHGAVIVGVSHDVVEAHVQRPPTTQEEAIALAVEQYLYCQDIVDQGAETICNLAATLINSTNWYFWWD